MKYLIDTNICIYIMNQRDISLIQKFKKLTVGDVGISSITLSELNYGVYKSSNVSINKVRLEEFLMPLEVSAYDEKSSVIYGQIRSQLEKKGQIIGPYDMLIASHAISEGLILITNNEKEFKRIKKLKYKNWIK